eukprot:CAMPEP_0195516336 /NCGR_PEP_ID=MMETSP0794_2-20130614/7095_1 /TAXON_ID=515487 /ORGANISM="Stephanopyxis turris, Strain CCMP 815" /LENGTH=426 /DNA_ID=CAMNT_0040644911 /DNA_START=114 /DNA_END=1391 /DNA_ORIENTATION=+
MRSTIVAGLTYAALLPFGAEGDLQADLDLVAAETSAKYNCTIAVSALVPDKKINVTSVAGKVSFLHGAPSTSPTEQFIWGSITKISTGSAILRLVEEGKITIDDTIPQYVDPMIAQMHSVDPDGFKYNSSEDLWGPEVADVTIRHLATMSSGIPDFDTAKPWPPPPVDPLRATIYNNSAHDYLPPELFSLPWVATGKLEFKPGTKAFAYSSTNFMLLGLILAQQAGAASWMSYDQSSFMTPSVRHALPTVDYVKCGAPADVTRLHGYDRTTYNGKNATIPGTDVVSVHGVFGGWTASDFTATVADAAAFAYAVYGPNSDLLTPAMQQVMIPGDTMYGFATFNLTGETGYAPPMGTAYGHIGATYGFDSMLSYHPEIGATIAIASNLENDDQTHPSETLCLAFAAVKNAVSGTSDVCQYTKEGYYGG